METLRAASHSLVMITGDATLTAAAVASDVALVEKPVAVLRDTVWENVDGTVCCLFVRIIIYLFFIFNFNFNFFNFFFVSLLPNQMNSRVYPRNMHCVCLTRR